MIKKYYDWFRLRLSPLLPIPTLLLLYFILGSNLEGNESWFNNWYGVTLQIIGGFQLVWAIDKNLRGFRSQTILQAIKRETIELFRSFPLWSKTNVVIQAGIGEIVFTGEQVRVEVSHNYTDLTQRVEFLERQFKRFEEMLDNRIYELQSKLDEQRRNFQDKVDEMSKTSSELKMLITDVAIGSIRGEITGFLIIVIGTVISAI